MKQSNRIKGFDIARGIAVFIMIFVNFEMVLAEKDTPGIYHNIFSFLHGKGAALFVVLAGVGISLMVKSARLSKDKEALKNKQNLLFKRAAFLFVFGLLYLPLWPADILHFYGFYLSIAALMSVSKSKWLWATIVLLILVYPLILMVVDYETGWDWNTTEYPDFWTFVGFLRNLFVNGFHPVIPWVAFVLAGLWLGRQNLVNKKRRNRILFISVFVLIIVQFFSRVSIQFTVSNQLLNIEDAIALLGTTPMPPLPLYMISGIVISYILIILCIIITEQFKKNKWIEALAITGQIAFTHYVGHVIIGMVSIYLLVGENGLSIGLTFWYAFVYCIISILFSLSWRKRHQRGPMAILMRKITG